MKCKGIIGWRGRVVVVCVVAFSLAAAGQAPTPVLERQVTIGQRTVRTSLFSNHVAVVTVRQGDTQVSFHRRTLELDEYMGYLMAFERDATELAEIGDRRSLESMGGRAEITLFIGPRVPHTIEYSPISVLNLATARLVAAIDDMEQRVVSADPSPAELEGWEPRRGDRVELRSGVKAKVVDVGDGGSITLEHDDTWILEVVPFDSRGAVILRVLEKKE